MVVVNYGLTGTKSNFTKINKYLCSNTSQLLGHPKHLSYHPNAEVCHSELKSEALGIGEVVGGKLLLDSHELIISQG